MSVNTSYPGSPGSHHLSDGHFNVTRELEWLEPLVESHISLGWAPAVHRALPFPSPSIPSFLLRLGPSVSVCIYLPLAFWVLGLQITITLPWSPSNFYSGPPCFSISLANTSTFGPAEAEDQGNKILPSSCFVSYHPHGQFHHFPATWLMTEGFMSIVTEMVPSTQ